MAYMTQTSAQGELNRLYPEDLPVHEWYRFVLSYPPHLVRTYLKQFGVNQNQLVLDPFCGTGTTLVECKKLGIPSVGLEANPVVHFAASTKLAWRVDPEALLRHAQEIARRVQNRLFQDAFSAETISRENLLKFSPEQEAVVITDSISPLPLHKVLILLEEIDRERDNPFWAHERLALAKQTVYAFSNLRFGPEVGVSTKKKTDAPVMEVWLESIKGMSVDLRGIPRGVDTPAFVHLADARQIEDTLEAESVDAVITSPPYPNEKDYSRTTRLESVLLGFLGERSHLKSHKSRMIVSNTRNVYKGDTDEVYVAQNARVQELADTIERTRLELEKTSGFERLYSKVVKLYFGGMARHLSELAPKLTPGAQLAYVVGDQASYFRVHIKTGEILAELARSLGYEVTSIDLFRNRFSTVTQNDLREEVVVLRWQP
jgi:hypothetical protein